MNAYEDMTDMDLEEMFEYLLVLGDFQDAELKRDQDSTLKDSDI